MERGPEESPPLDCSVARVQQHAMGSSKDEGPFLMSSGHGDLVGPLQHLPGLVPTLHFTTTMLALAHYAAKTVQDLVASEESMAARIRASDGYTPLQLKRLDGRPFCIEGAWQAAPGDKPVLLCCESVH